MLQQLKRYIYKYCQPLKKKRKIVLYWVGSFFFFWKEYWAGSWLPTMWSDLQWTYSRIKVEINYHRMCSKGNLTCTILYEQAHGTTCYNYYLDTNKSKWSSPLMGPWHIIILGLFVHCRHQLMLSMEVDNLGIAIIILRCQIWLNAIPLAEACSLKGGHCLLTHLTCSYMYLIYII